MSVTIAVAARLLAITAVTTLVGTRVWALKWPENPTAPALRVQLIGEIEQLHLRGSSGLARARVQVDAMAREASGVNPYEVAEAVIAAAHGSFVMGVATGLNGWQGTIGSPAVQIVCIEPAGKREMYDPEELRQVTVSRDYFVTFRT